MYKRILVPIDGSRASQRGLEEAAKLAKVCGATVGLVHIVNELVLEPGYVPLTNYTQIVDALREGGQKVLRAAEEAVRKHGVTCESELIETFGEHAAQSIVAKAASWSADLIVMGTHGRRGIRRLALGSDAEVVLRHAPVPVLMVRDVPEKT